MVARLRIALLGLPLLGSVGCDPTTAGQAVTTGELNRGVFKYSCAGSNDAICSGQGSIADHFPQRFAVGGEFALAFDATADERAPVETSAPSLIEPTFSGLISQFRFVRPGTAALIAFRNRDEIVDYLHITAERVLSYHFTDDQGSEGLTELTLEVGESRTITVEPRGELGQLLAGTLDYAWSTDDFTVARLASVTTARSVRIQAVGPGTTRLIVEGGEVTGSVQVTVEDSSGTTTGSSETDGGTDPDPGTTTGLSETDTDTEAGSSATGGTE